MALSYVGQATGITSATLPTHQAGDLILAFAYRDGSTTAPTVPGTWTTISSGTGGGGTSNSSALAYIIASAPGTSSGTWTNATGVVFQVYRGSNKATPIGSNATSTGSTNTINYPALTGISTGSWVAGFAGHRSIDTTIETAPSGMTNRSDYLDATNEVVGHDTNSGVSSWSSTNVTITGTASNWISRVVELESTQDYFLTETYNGTGQIDALLGNSYEATSILVGAGTVSLTPTVIINNGIRITENGNRRVTQGGVDRRILQGYVASGLLYDVSLALAGAGTVSYSASVTRNVTSALNGAGTFYSLPSLFLNSIASLAGALTQNSSAALIASPTLSLAGAGTLSASGLISKLVSSGLSGAGTFDTVASLYLNGQVSLIGALSQLSASTFTAGATTSLTGAGTVSASASAWKNLSTTLNSTGTVQALLGYQLDISGSLNGTGQVAPSSSVTRNVSSPLNGAGSFVSIADRIVSTSLTLNSVGTISSSASFFANAQFNGQGIGTLGSSASVLKIASSSLQATGTFGISPRLIEAASSMVGGAGTIWANGGILRNINSSLTSTGSLNGNILMIYNAQVTGDTLRRITQDGSPRITSTGDFRIIPGGLNAGYANIIATATLIPFARGLYAKVGTQWGLVTARIKRSGSWVTPKTYVKHNNTWKRVY